MAYRYNVHGGYTQEEILAEIPQDLRSFFMMARYKEVLANCVLFNKGPC